MYESRDTLSKDSEPFGRGYALSYWSMTIAPTILKYLLMPTPSRMLNPLVVSANPLRDLPSLFSLAA